MRYTTAIALAGATLFFAGSVSAQTTPAAGADKAKEMFVNADTNKDGVLTADEWQAAGRRDRGFAMIDANRDGKITPDEMRTAAAKRGG